MNIILIISIILFIVSVLLIIFSYFIIGKTKEVNLDVEKKNKELDNHNQFLLKQNKELNDLKRELDNTLNLLNQEKETATNTLHEKQSELSSILDKINNQQELSKKAFENYCDILEKQYEKEEKEFDNHKEDLRKSYNDLQTELKREIDLIKKDLDKISATRAAAIKAQLKEKEIEENLSFYCLKISDSELKDIAVLETIKPKLNNSRILSMLIWQSFFRTPMTNLCNQVIGKATATGIYKITNQITKECYIGQAVDLAERFKQHAKCGLGIDAPANNKLYKAMQEYGIQNFSWEIIEKCSREQLNEKEKYYINLYQSKEYGYNTLAGIKKKEN